MSERQHVEALRAGAECVHRLAGEVDEAIALPDLVRGSRLAVELPREARAPEHIRDLLFHEF
jgi:hypothetical protein